MLYNKNDDFDFISNKFEQENITAPDALSENAVEKMLDGKKAVKIKFAKTKTFKCIVSVAACIAIVVTSLTVARPIANEGKPLQKSSNAQGICSFSDYSEIKKTINKIEKENIEFSLYFEKAETADDMASSSSGGLGTAEGGASVDDFSSYAQTYKQVEAVDEADIIKNDGKYIYYVNGESLISIYEIKGKNTKLISSINDFEQKYDPSLDTEIFESQTIYDIYVTDNVLVVNVDKYMYNNITDLCKSFTQTYLYDISDIKNPKQTNKFEQSGDYISSRMINDKLYIASNFSASKKSKEYVPYICDDNKDKQELGVADICYFEEPDTPSYLVISAIDVKTGKRTSKSKAVLGSGGDIYCSLENMYVMAHKYNYSANMLKAPETTSQIIKISLSDEIEFTASCKIQGYINNQFSLDEKDGFLRVATTSQNSEDKQVNNLFIFDENLKEVGSVTGFAKDESIKAVKFIKDMAYVITYEQTDPLFIIDLSNPTSPQIKGSVKITGFSSQLVPVDENTLLGIGYDVQENEWGGISEDGIKLALFDISDCENPKVLDSKAFENSYSTAQYNHKAIVVNDYKGYYAIPFEHFVYDEDNYYNDFYSGVLTFKVESGKIKVLNKYTKGYDSTNGSRCTYADDYLYSFTEYYNDDMQMLIDLGIYEIK